MCLRGVRNYLGAVRRSSRLSCHAPIRLEQCPEFSFGRPERNPADLSFGSSQPIRNTLCGFQRFLSQGYLEHLNLVWSYVAFAGIHELPDNRVSRNEISFRSEAIIVPVRDLHFLAGSDPTIPELFGNELDAPALERTLDAVRAVHVASQRCRGQEADDDDVKQDERVDGGDDIVPAWLPYQPDGRECEQLLDNQR